MAKITEVPFENQADDNLGEIKITTGVLESIAAQAASEIEGVVSKVTGFQKEVGNFLGMDRDRINTKITIEEEQIIVNVEVRVLYGYSVPEIAMAIQDKVKEQILFMTDLAVQEVNVHILSVETESLADYNDTVEEIGDDFD
ncbi:Asp23/Gls24 family envelope stress response protein [Aerococcaceae bacterium WGS1372]